MNIYNESCISRTLLHAFRERSKKKELVFFSESVLPNSILELPSSFGDSENGLDALKHVAGKSEEGDGEGKTGLQRETVRCDVPLRERDGPRSGEESSFQKDKGRLREKTFVQRLQLSEVWRVRQKVVLLRREKGERFLPVRKESGEGRMEISSREDIRLGRRVREDAVRGGEVPFPLGARRFLLGKGKVLRGRKRRKR